MTQSSKYVRSLRRFISRTVRFDSRFLLVLMTLTAIGVLWYQDRQGLEKRLLVLEARINPVPLNSASWGVEQATGAPNTRTAGDQPTAWASQTPDGQPEWLEVHYPQAVKPTQIEVYETYNPGAIYKVTGFDQFGNEGTLWEGTDPTAVNSGMGVSTFDVKNGFSTDRIRIYLASDKVPGWNEIDAVGVKHGWLGRILWADKAKASSTFGIRGGFGSGPPPNFGLSR